MKSLYLKSGKIQDVFNDLKETLNGTLSVSNGEHNLVLNSDLVSGTIEAVTFPEGMFYLQLELMFNDDAMLSIENSNNSPIFFVYCSEGSLKHSLGTMGKITHLKKYHSSILKSTSTINNIVHFEKNVPIKLSVIGIGTDKNRDVTNEVLIKKLQHTFSDQEENVMHLHSFDFKISQKLNELSATMEQVVAKKSLRTEIVHSILEMEIDQHTDTFSKISEGISCSAQKQFDEIKKVSNYIMNFPVEEFALKFLGHKTRLSLNKFPKRLNS